MIIPPAPPKLEDLRAGTKLKAGLSVSTVLADIDFETYSEAGFIWNGSKYDMPPNASKKGLPGVGIAVYAEHPSTEVLSCAYDLKDGKGKRLWTPIDPLPIDLMQHVFEGNLIEAWNCAFERWIWNYVCVPKYGWHPIRIEQMRDAMAKARAHALPGSLDPAGMVLDIKNKKLKDGMRLINKFSIPRTPTKADPRRRILPIDDPADQEKLHEYNLMDIAAEAEISSLIPDLSDDELAFWICDHRINDRGVQIDLPVVHAAIRIIESAYAKYNADLSTLTSGAVSAASEVARIKQWLMTYEIHVSSLDALNVRELLERPALAPEVRRVLEIREAIGSAAVKKLYAMVNQSSSRGRLHELFVYHSARTGRAAGAGAQPQNLPNSGPDVWQCDSCGKYRGPKLEICPWCGMGAATKREWCPRAVIDAVETIKSGSLQCVEWIWGDALATISGCLRGLFIAAPKHDLICSDYSAIEAVVLAELAGEEWRIDVFNTHGKIYEASAAAITGKTLDYYLEYKKETGSHHSDRKLGKVAELACFTRDTQVLTDRGYVDIVDVLLTDKLWDGIEWVTHAGIVYKGKKEIIDLDGVKITPSHPVCLGNSWKEAKLLSLNENTLFLALAIGSENLPLSPYIMTKSTLLARAKKLFTQLLFLTYKGERVHGALNAQEKKLKRPILKNILNTPMFYQIRNTVDVWLTGCVRQLRGVLAFEISNLTATEVGELEYANHGKTMRANFCVMSLLFRDGIILHSKWIVLMLTEIMKKVIFVLYPEKKILLIKEKSMIFKNESTNLKNVYDIVNAGSRNRFTIKTNSGHLLVHNSGYGGWLGAWKQFGADSHFASDDEIKQSILKWRHASPAIVEFWGGQEKKWQPCFYGLEGAAILAVMNPGEIYSHQWITYQVHNDILYCTLLSGRRLTYHRPRLEPSERRPGTLSLSFEGWNSNPMAGAMGWTRMWTYGGKLTENVVQATARDILAHAIVNLERAGYPVVLHVHDEIVAEVPEGVGSIDEFERIMSTMPEWASHWPVRAQGGWRAKRYGK